MRRRGALSAPCHTSRSTDFRFVLTCGPLAMMIPAPLPGTNPNGTAAESEPPTAPPATPLAAAPAIAYVEFAVCGQGRSAGRSQSPICSPATPCCASGLCNLGGSAGPQELKALLCETVGTLFGNPRDEKLRRILELDLFPARPRSKRPSRIGLLFLSGPTGVTSAPRAIAWRVGYGRPRAYAPIPSELPAAAMPMPTIEKSEGETAALPEAGEPASPRLSVVVLPFLNIGGSAEDDPFVDGITETLTTDLSRSPGVFVISRSTAFAYKGKPIDVRQIGHELGVRYVLEGSVQNAGGRMRFNAQLVDADSGGHLWAERFDKQRGDLLDMQDEVTTRLARTIHIEMIAAESRRAARERPGPSRRGRSHPSRLGRLEPEFVARVRRGGPAVFSKRRCGSTSKMSGR